MADRYWVGGTGSWNSSSTTNWSASSGGASGASVPGVSDNVIFDQNSNTGTTNFTVTIDGSGGIFCINFTVQNLDGALTFSGTNSGLQVLGNITFPATGMTFGYTGSLTISGTAASINTNGVSIAAPVTFSGSGTRTLQSAFTCSSTVTIIAGTLDLNGYNLTTTALLASTSTTNTRVIAFGAGSITTTGTGTVWNVIGSTTFSVTGTPTVNISNNTATALTVNHTSLEAGTVMLLH